MLINFSESNLLTWLLNLIRVSCVIDYFLIFFLTFLSLFLSLYEHFLNSWRVTADIRITGHVTFQWFNGTFQMFTEIPGFHGRSFLVIYKQKNWFLIKLPFSHFSDILYCCVFCYLTLAPRIWCTQKKFYLELIKEI